MDAHCTPKRHLASEPRKKNDSAYTQILQRNCILCIVFDYRELVASETNVVAARQIYSTPLNPSAVETGQNRYLRAKMRIHRNNR